MMTTVTLTLTDFLLARIGEDEAVARYPSSAFVGETGWYRDGDREVVELGIGRALAECEAKRRILAEHAPMPLSRGGRGVAFCSVCWTGTERGEPEPTPCFTIRLLALPYSDHHDFRPEWRTSS